MSTTRQERDYTPRVFGITNRFAQVILGTLSNLTGSVHAVDFASQNAHSIFESWTHVSQTCSRTNRFAICASARTRTWNDCSEDSCDIHFTTEALPHTTRDLGEYTGPY